MSNSIILETCWLLTAVDAFSHQLRPLVALQLTRARRLIYPLTGYKLHGSSRPISMKSDVIRKRAHHDARRVGNGPLAIILGTDAGTEALAKLKPDALDDEDDHPDEVGEVEYLEDDADAR